MTSTGAGRYDINIKQGATFPEVFTVRDGSGALLNLTGYTARMQARSSYSSETVYLDLTTANGKIVLGGVLGTVQLVLSAVFTAALLPFRGRYDLELVSAGGIVTPLLEGRLNVYPEITR